MTCILVPLALFIWHKFLQPIVDMLYGKKPLSDKAASNESDTKNGTMKNEEIDQDMTQEMKKESVVVESSKDK
mgnify:FL=1